MTQTDQLKTLVQTALRNGYPIDRTSRWNCYMFPKGEVALQITPHNGITETRLATTLLQDETFLSYLFKGQDINELRKKYTAHAILTPELIVPVVYWEVMKDE